MQAINIEDLRGRARRRLPKVIFEFIDGGAQDETTLRANCEDFQKWRFRTRVLTDVSRRDQSIALLGQRCASPSILAPTGLAGLLSRRGESAAARAAEKYGVPYCLSTMATCRIEEITTGTAQPKWFQLYVLRDRGLTKEFIERARASRCTALVLTVDTKVQGPRARYAQRFHRAAAFHSCDDSRLRPPFFLALRRGPGPRIAFRNFEGTKAAATDAVTITEFIAGQYDLTVNWRDVEWFKSAWGGPVLAQGHTQRGGCQACRGAWRRRHNRFQSRRAAVLEGAVSAVHALPAIADAVTA